MSASPDAPFPPVERSGPPPGRGPTAAEAYPFFFPPEEREPGESVRRAADALLLGEPEPGTADESVAVARRVLAALGERGIGSAAIGPLDPSSRGALAGAAPEPGTRAHAGSTRVHPTWCASLRRCVTREEVAYASPLADAVLAVQGLGAHPLILSGASARPEIARLLEQAARAEVVFGFAVTEPDAGSDVSRIACAARRDGDSWVLTGTKAFISNAGVATHYTLFARTAEGKKGISCFLVPASAARVELTELNAAHPVGVLRFESARVASSALLGDEGDGLKLALGTLDIFRPSVGAAAIGMGRRALDEALAHVEARVQFGAPLAENAQIQALLAQAATELEAARLLVYRAAWLQDRGAARSTLESSMAKLAATEAAQKAIDLAVQLSGGLGVVRGRTVERLYRAVRALRIYEGASEVMRVVIARELRKARATRG